MAESMLLTEEEEKQLLTVFTARDKMILKNIAEGVNVFFRSIEGKPLDPTDFILKFTNVKNVHERSRYPTYPILEKQVYAQIIDIVHPEAEICATWSRIESEDLISYKGKSREENVEISKRAFGGETQQIVFGAKYGEEIKKKRFWQRGKKAEESEFVNQ